MAKSSVDRKRSRYGEKYSLRFHKQLKIYNLSCNDEIPSLIAKFVETDGDLAMKLFERLESNYKENEQLKSFKQRVFDLIDKTIEEETQIAENIEEVAQETRPYAKAVNRITIKTLENLKWELQE